MKRISFLIFLLFFSLIIPTMIYSNDAEIPIFFELDLLIPDTSEKRIEWNIMIAEELQKIGIGVDIIELTDWRHIAPRTWSYPVGVDYDYIPIYDKGGYDVLFIGWTWDLDWDPTGIFDSPCLCPHGDNYYQYANPDYDDTLTDYLRSLNATERNEYGYQLQDIIYEDLPALYILYERELMAYRNEISGINPLLLNLRSHRAEYWGDDIDQEITVATPTLNDSTNIWSQCVYGSLFERSHDSNDWEAMIALNATLEEYKIDRNYKLNITVNLDPSAKFSDGSPVLPEDIKYSYELLMSPLASYSEYSYLASWFGSNDSIEITIPGVGGQLNFTLGFIYNFALSVLSHNILDKTFVEPLIASYGYNIFNQPLMSENVTDTLVTSCGPFKLSKYHSENGSLELTPNQYWSGDFVDLNKLFFTFIPEKTYALDALYDGTVDVIDSHYDLVPLDFSESEYITSVLAKVPAHQEISVNMIHPVIGKGGLCPIPGETSAKAVRKAISHIIPRQRIIDEILEGVGAPGVSFCPDASPYFDSSRVPYAYDIDIAKEYMKQAGYSFGIEETTTTDISFILLSLIGLATIGFIYKLRKLRFKRKND